MPFQNLYNNIFDTNETGDNQVEMLERQVKRYPYFTLAHFFLLKHTGPGHPAYAGVAARTAMHFNHPFFLHEQLHKVADAQVTTDNEFASVFHTPGAIPEEIVEVKDDGGHDKIYPEEEIMLGNGIEKNVGPAPEEQHPFHSVPEELPAAQVEIPMQELVSSEESTQTGEAQGNENRPHIEEEAVETSEPEEPYVLPQSSHLEPVQTVEIEPVAEINPEKEAPLFEPLFATDYFASQGIKLRDEVLTNDKLGKQLRSFTDWLKTMKKVHEGKLPAGSETLDLSVQKLAEKSNKEEEVITETMAEVYLQQGKQQKAKEIYEKLSLLDPSKMAYFAAKIEQIQ